jgi:RNA polymerase sigma-70 factor (ECF subfamily)
VNTEKPGHPEPSTSFYSTEAGGEEAGGEVNNPWLAAARAGDQAAFEALCEPHRKELIAHCYRMLGSLQDAEDMVQETWLRAWRRLETYEGRAPFRAWLYKIATNACLDALKRRASERQAGRALPQALRAASDPGEPIQPPVLEPIWLEPFPDELLPDREAGPEARYHAYESITLAFMTALQELPGRQRSALILCDVLDWPANEAAELFETTIPAVNSLLHRARTRMDKKYSAKHYEDLRLAQADDETRTLLDRYVQAWEAGDIDGFVALLKDDATFPMPPLPLWYRGREDIRVFVAGTSLAGEARGRWRFLPTRANGLPAFGLYQRDERAGLYQPFAIQLLTIRDGSLADITTFGYPGLFRLFGLPEVLPA